MKIDGTDIKIILTILSKGGEITSTEIAKHVFDIKDYRDLQNKDSKVRRRLKKLTKYNLLKRINNGGKYYYEINKENILIAFKIDGNLILADIVQ